MVGPREACGNADRLTAAPDGTSLGFLPRPFLFWLSRERFALTLSESDPASGTLHEGLQPLTGLRFVEVKSAAPPWPG